MERSRFLHAETCRQNTELSRLAGNVRWGLARSALLRQRFAWSWIVIPSKETPRVLGDELQPVQVCADAHTRFLAEHRRENVWQDDAFGVRRNQWGCRSSSLEGICGAGSYRRG